MRREVGPRRAGFILCGLIGSCAASAQSVIGSNQPFGNAGFPDASGTEVAHGLQATYGVDAGVGETDNINLTPTNKVSQTIAVTDLDFDVKERSERLDADARGDFSYLDYLQGAYGSELIGRFDGNAALGLIQDRLVWRFQDDFGQAQVDPFAPITPANRENVNYASTGPDLLLRFGPNLFLTAGAHYVRTDYQKSPFDSNRLDGSLGVGTQLSSRSSVSVDGTYERVLFSTTVIDNLPVNSDFSRTSVFGRYELEGARTTLAASLGVSRVVQAGDSRTDPTVRLDVTRQLSSASKLILSLGRTLTDSSTGFSNLQAGNPQAGNMQGGAVSIFGTAPAAQALVNYTATYATAEWSYRRNRTGLSISGNWERDQYSGQPNLNVSRAIVQVRLERELTRSLSVNVFANAGRTDYPNPDLAEVEIPQTIAVNPDGRGFAETDAQAGTSVVYRYGRALEIRLRYDHTTRIVSGVGSGGGFQDNRVFLLVGYRPKLSGSV